MASPTHSIRIVLCATAMAFAATGCSIGERLTPVPIAYPDSPAHVGDPEFRCHLDDTASFAQVQGAAQASLSVYQLWSRFPDRGAAGDDEPVVFPADEELQAEFPGTSWTLLDYYVAPYDDRGFAVLAAVEGGACYLSFKGTSDAGDARRDLQSLRTTDCVTEDGASFGRCGAGFFTVIRGLREPDVDGRSRGEIIERVHAWAEDDTCTGGLVVTGHSLGGALADVFAANYHARFGDVLDIVTFAGPRSFADDTADTLEALFGGRKLRIVRRGDGVPNTPQEGLGFSHFGRTLELSQAVFDDAGEWYLWQYDRDYTSNPGLYHSMTAYRDGTAAACSVDGVFDTRGR